ncbi:mitochondrial assembly of ribosomal large subunit protein 1 [Epinephelus fuscoguttatus]|uniref:mitochondrial assembly of ribosomal large subunit protein 1 n=1 Tax=Epinephelus fuscoguttatus TaxID=293821 RepID=UPI0020D10B62|nr:mitochondrial assembly of ribosomal large subunit protein 1 [Epinephelus fuscoguttatus]
MNILGRCKKLVSPVYKSRVLLEQAGVFRSVCSVSEARCDGLCLPRRFTANVSSCQHWHHVSTCHLNTKRFYSEVCSENSNSKMSAGVFEEESQVIDGDLRDSSAPRQRSPETFNLDVLVSLLRQENAVDICVIKVPEQIKYTEYFIVVSGVSPRHLRAMALYAIKTYKFLKKDRAPNVRIEGKDSEDWMCIDFGNMVVHFMLPEQRELYELEKLWTLRMYDEQLKSIPPEKLPEDFIYDAEVTK